MIKKRKMCLAKLNTLSFSFLWYASIIIICTAASSNNLGTSDNEKVGAAIERELKQWGTS